MRGQLRGLMLRRQRVDQFTQRFARDHLRQLIERQIDTVVGDTALRKIVGPDALGTVAGADFLLAVGGARGVDALTFGTRVLDTFLRSC